jgi:DNA-binding PadR family transcriptional regulator
MANDWKNGDPNWRRMEAMARRGWNRLAAGMEGSDWLGGNLRIGRMLAAGDIRLVALYLIEQQPRHGYDLIKAIEEKSGGFYAPSPGVVYPALTFLEEAGFVTSQSEGNKKLYTITPEGRTHLADNREAIESTLSFLHKAGEQMSRFREFARADWPFGRTEAAGEGYGAQSAQDQPAEPADRDLRDVVPELNDARRALKAAIKTARKASPDQQRRAAEILRKAARDIEALGEDDEVDL